MRAQVKPVTAPLLDAALDQLMVERWPPDTWQQIQGIDALPPRLGRLAGALHVGAWRACSDGERVRFAVGEPTRASGRQMCELKVSFYDADARLCGAGIWTQPVPGQWLLREALD